MKLTEVLSCDTRNEGVSQEIQAWLKRIPVFSKYEDEDVPFDKIEIAMWKLLAKYDLSVSGMFMSKPTAPTRYYSCSVWKNGGRDVVMSLNGATIYELFAKVVLLCYAKRPKE